MIDIPKKFSNYNDAVFFFKSSFSELGINTYFEYPPINVNNGKHLIVIQKKSISSFDHGFDVKFLKPLSNGRLLYDSFMDYPSTLNYIKDNNLYRIYRLTWEKNGANHRAFKPAMIFYSSNGIKTHEAYKILGRSHNPVGPAYRYLCYENIWHNLFYIRGIEISLNYFCKLNQTKSNF